MVPGGRHADGVHVVLNGCVENRLHHVAVTNDDLIVRMTQFRRGASDVDELDKPDSSKEKGRSGAELCESMGSRERLQTLLASSAQGQTEQNFHRIPCPVCGSVGMEHPHTHYAVVFVGAILFFSATGDVAPPRLGVLGFWSVPPWCRLLDSGASLWRK